jgi:hypothetical protein
MTTLEDYSYISEMSCIGLYVVSHKVDYVHSTVSLWLLGLYHVRNVQCIFRSPLSQWCKKCQLQYWFQVTLYAHVSLLENFVL